MSSSRAFRVIAPTRLHFGLLAIGEGAGASGGAGAMLAEPCLVLDVRPADRFVASGLHHDRVAAFANRWANGRAEALPPVELRVDAAPDQHIGLGLGTQLALATALSLDRVSGHNDSGPETLAALVGRGARSGIGVRGFFFGGFLAEDEKRDGDALAPLERHLPFPALWRFVLVRRRGEAGAHGASEDRFFRALPPTPRDVTERMRHRLFEGLVPAIERGDFDAFAESAYRFGRESGELFRGAQAGAYASDFAERLVKRLREHGIRGVGQTSWGPTLWIAAPDPQTADAFAADLRSELDSDDVEITIGVPSPSGMRVEPTPVFPSFPGQPDEALSGLRQDA